MPAARHVLAHQNTILEFGFTLLLHLLPTLTRYPLTTVLMTATSSLGQRVSLRIGRIETAALQRFTACGFLLAMALLREQWANQVGGSLGTLL